MQKHFRRTLITAASFLLALASSTGWSASFTYELFSRPGIISVFGSWGTMTFEGHTGDLFPDITTEMSFNLVSPYTGQVYTQVIGEPRTTLRSFDGSDGHLGDSLLTADWMNGNGSLETDTFWQFFTDRFTANVIFRGNDNVVYREVAGSSIFERTSIHLDGGFPVPSLDLRVDHLAPAWYVQLKAVTAPIPEPETYAMLLVGLTLLGFATRRRNRTTAAA